jgi:membrane carboxypeptidase/penicillin-binding protein PbpC
VDLAPKEFLSVLKLTEVFLKIYYKELPFGQTWSSIRSAWLCGYQNQSNPNIQVATNNSSHVIPVIPATGEAEAEDHGLRPAQAKVSKTLSQKEAGHGSTSL